MESNIWNIFNDIIVNMFKLNCYKEETLLRLATIIKSEDFENSFVLERDSSMTMEKYNKKTKYYKSFTIWTLGRFFYLLNNEKLYKIHNVLIDAQVNVIRYLSKTQLHIYDEIAWEYGKALKLLTSYYTDNGADNIILNVFQPSKSEDLDVKLDLCPVFVEISDKESCVNLLVKVIKFHEFILAKNFTFGTLKDEHLTVVMECFHLLLNKSTISLKLNILEIYASILEIEKINQYSVLKERGSMFFNHFKSIVYGALNGTLEMSPKEQEKFIQLFYKILCNITSQKNIQDIINLTFSECNEANKLQYFDDKLFCELLKNSSLIHNLRDNNLNKNDFKNNLSRYNLIQLVVLKKSIQQEILKHSSELHSHPHIRVFNKEISTYWNAFVDIFFKQLDDCKCDKSCIITEVFQFSDLMFNILIEINIEALKTTKNQNKPLAFFPEGKLFMEIIKKLNNHFENCNQKLLPSLYLKFFVNFMLVTNCQNLVVLFEIMAYPYIKKLEEQNLIKRRNYFIGFQDTFEFRDLILKFNINLEKQCIENLECLKYLNMFMVFLTCGLLQNVNQSEIETIGNHLMKILNVILQNQDNNELLEFIEMLPHIASYFPKSEEMFRDSFYRIRSQNEESLKKSLPIFHKIVCMSYSDYIKVFALNKDTQTCHVDIYCEKCFSLNKKTENSVATFVAENYPGKVAIFYKFSKFEGDFSSTVNTLFNNALKSLISKNGYLRIEGLKVIPALTNHLLKFNTLSAVQIWMDLADDSNELVQKTFRNVLIQALKNNKENEILPDEVKQKMLEEVLGTLLKLTKKSLRMSDFPLQNHILNTIYMLIYLKNDKISIEIFKMLLYFVMVPTSKYYIVATNHFYSLAKIYNKRPHHLYQNYSQEISAVIVHLIIINKQAANYGLVSSLERLAVILDFSNVKWFISSEYKHLLPHFIEKIPTKPLVKQILDEMAMLMEIERNELLCSMYGYIFLHLFLNCEQECFQACMDFLEKTTGLSGPLLRKRNFQVILNNLLLHFHNKEDKVKLALSLLIKEDSERSSNSMTDYLKPHFLGVLVFFLGRLMQNELQIESIFKSLATIMQFMGPKNVSSVRFKIISMLQSINYERYPELVVDVWHNFVRNCDVEILGPHLATIFVSLQLLLKWCPSKINSIYKYLLVENQKALKDYIKDLFFLDCTNIDQSVIRILQTHLSAFKECNFTQKLKLLLKYLHHETVEVRIQSIKELKSLMEQNREEIDRMILGYNGIDESIVELIDILTNCCRENDEKLKLACGELISELGAIEPSHFPRRYTQDTKTFAYFIHEDNFLLNSLRELIRAIQADKNAAIMDRTALAIQGILQIYDISPNQNSAKHNLWKQFTESDQEVMVPLLSSRYKISRPINSNNPIPIYGSDLQDTFESWLYNWTCSLIYTLPNERKKVLEVCLPSMKDRQRVLMHFLPHILLHSVIEGSSQDVAFQEIQAVLTSFNKKNNLNENLLSIIQIPTVGIKNLSPSNTANEIDKIQCAKVIFVLLDFLNRWLREWHWEKKMAARNDSNFKKLKNFLDRFCKFQLAKVNYQCGEYARALMYLEDYISSNKTEFADNLSFLSEIYALLDEPDGVAGITAIRQTEPSIEDRILALEVSGKLSDAAACYERLKPPLKIYQIQGLVQCYLDLDNVNTALNFARGAINTHIEFGNQLLEMEAEPLWRLSRYDELDGLLKRSELHENKSWGVQIGKALIHFDKGERNEFINVIECLKLQQVNFIGATSLEEGAYQHGYKYISRLHAINELHQIEKLVYDLLVQPNDEKFAENSILKIKSDWDLRIKVVQESIHIVEPILCLRRVALDMGKRIVRARMPHAVAHFDSLLGETWLQSAKFARLARIHQQAYTYLLKAEEFAPPKLFIEKARLHWLREENEQAMTTLQRGLAIIQPSRSSQEKLSLEQKKLCAEAKLLIATYNDTNSNVDTEMNMLYYREAVEIHKEWEKSLVCLAQYHDKILNACSESDIDSKHSERQVLMINYFGKSLKYGTTYVYQSLPRLLSIWFDYGTRLLDVTQTKLREERRNSLLKMTRLIDQSLEQLPVYIFLTAFSQIVSRICHPQKEVYIELKSIIIKLLLNYPQHTLWMMISVIQSSYSMRAKRCTEILNDPKIKNSPVSTLIKDFTDLAEKLTELCNKEITTELARSGNLSVSLLLRSLPRLLKKPNFSEIMVPTHKFRKLVLPNPDFSVTTNHNPFPNMNVYIIGIEEEMTVLQSMQKPRKITLRGSDGKGYIQMLKPKDDLRKDFRLMEFNDIVNQLLSREAEARERRLNIRLYSVAPLNEECGLIEWVHNLVGLRPILMNLYQQNGLGMKNAELKESICDLKDPISKKRDIFLKKLLPRHPPILGEWFKKNFPDPQSWLMARTAYIRTTAVISMVGYVLGLGDRHGENIQLDSLCGDTVHVDFNCLFNKGESLEVPERVPFRLTHNMVGAMGPLGVEGVFRKSCACTLRVLRTNTPTLMSIVTPFVYDPLVSWPRNQVSLMHTATAERTNEQAVDHIKNIEQRLQGIVRIKNSRSLSIPLSVEGQTNILIKEATDVDNLCQMYFGWGPYL